MQDLAYPKQLFIAPAQLICFGSWFVMEIRLNGDHKFDLLVKKKWRIPQQNNLGHNVLWIVRFSTEKSPKPRNSDPAFKHQKFEVSQNQGLVHLFMKMSVQVGADPVLGSSHLSWGPPGLFKSRDQILFQFAAASHKLHTQKAV